MTQEESSEKNAAARPTRILVVDDEHAIRTALADLLREEGYEVHTAADGYKALGKIDGWEPDVVITDVKMPALGGIELMGKLRERLPEVAVIVMTAHSSVEGAVDAMRLGADDYLSKPVLLPQILQGIQRVLAGRSLQREATLLRRALAESDRSPDASLVGESRPFRDLLALAQQVATSAVSVLIHGESGTGKQSLARQIHAWSGRPGSFVALASGELEDLDGLRQPAGSTVFLADVDELSPALQSRLLRALQARDGGGDADTALDVRIIAGTSRDLAAEARAGRFRDDLFYRLGVVTLRVPSLRERQDDIAPLARHFLKHFVRQTRRPIAGFSERALGALLHFDWPGNVRQLEHCIEHAVAVARQREIEPRDLPRELMTKTHAGDDAPPVIPGTSIYEIERYAILRTLEHVGGSTSKAAKILGISPRKIQYRLQEYRGEAPPSPPGDETPK